MQNESKCECERAKNGGAQCMVHNPPFNFETHKSHMEAEHSRKLRCSEGVQNESWREECKEILFQFWQDYKDEESSGRDKAIETATNNIESLVNLAKQEERERIVGEIEKYLYHCSSDSL